MNGTQTALEVAQAQNAASNQEAKKTQELIERFLQEIADRQAALKALGYTGPKVGRPKGSKTRKKQEGATA